MQFIFIGNPKEEVLRNPPSNFQEKIEGDQSKSREYFGRGIFRQLWTSGKGTIFLCEAASRQELESLLSVLPMAQAGLIDIDIREVSPYSGFTQ